MLGDRAFSRRALAFVVLSACASPNPSPPVDMTPMRSPVADEDGGLRHVILHVGETLTIKTSNHIYDFMMIGPPVDGRQTPDDKAIVLRGTAPGTTPMLLINDDGTQTTYLIDVIAP